MYDKNFQEIINATDKAFKDMQSGEYEKKEVVLPKTSYQQNHQNIMDAYKEMVKSDEVKKDGV